jgi:hypothetical protein
MRILNQVKSWVDQEVPDSEAIVQTLDNLCYQLAGATTQDGKAEIEAAIGYLLEIHPEPKPDLVRPETQLIAQPDPSLLIPVTDFYQHMGQQLSPQEKRDEFLRLKQCLGPH